MIRDREELRQILDYLSGAPELQRATVEAFREQEARRVPQYWDDIPESEQPEWLDRMADSPSLTEWEQEFVASLSERDQVSFTAKQIAVVDRCLFKLRGALS